MPENDLPGTAPPELAGAQDGGLSPIPPLTPPTDAAGDATGDARTPPPPPDRPAQGSAPAGSDASPPWKAVAAWCLERSRRLALAAWQFAGDTARYYWGVRQALWEYVAGFAPNMMSESVRMREVRLASYEVHPLVHYDSAGWKVAIPGRCVVCGEPEQGPPLDETLSIDNAARAFWLPVATFLAGATFALIFGRWLVLAGVVAGGALGYLMREKVSVALRVVRCRQHADRTNIPQVFVWGNTLVMRFGHKFVRKTFLYGETMDTAVPRSRAADTGAPAADFEPAPRHVPETIPLDEGPAPGSAPIRHDAPPVYGQDDEFHSPLVP